LSAWPSVALYEVALVGAGNAAPQNPKLFENGSIPFIRTSDVGRIRFGNIGSAEDCLNDAGAKALKLWPAGTILFPKSGASTFLNHRVMMDVEGCVASHLATIVPNTRKALGRFIQYFLHTIRAQDLTQDQNYPSLRLPEIGAIQIPLPSIEEQERIVAILDELFEGISKAASIAERNIQNAREVLEAVRDAIFEDGGTDWLSGTLGRFVSIKHGFAFKSEHFREDGEYVLLTPGNFFEHGGYRDRGAKQKRYTGPVPNGFILNPGDLLVAMTEQAPGLLGSPLIVPDGDTFLHNQRLGLVKPTNDAKWVPELLEHLFNTRRFRARVHADGTGVKVRHTSPEKLSAVPVKFPATIDAQRELCARLSALQNATRRLESIQVARHAALAELKQSLLHRAFTGQLTSADDIAA